MKLCPNCGNQAADHAIFCDQCGTRLPDQTAQAVEAPAVEPEETVMYTPGSIPEEVVICPACGAENVPGEIFCDACGEPLASPEPVVVEEEVIEEAPVAEAIVEAVVDEIPVPAEVVPEEEAVVEAAAVAVPGFCTVCGSPVAADDAFCSACGAALSKAAAGPAVQKSVPQPPPESPPEPAVELPVVEEPILETSPAEETIVIEEVVEEVEEELACPACGARITPGQRFCGDCGAALADTTTTAPQMEPVQPKAVTAPSGPYLEVVASGAHIPLVLQPQLLVGRLDEVSGIEPEIDMTPHGGLDGGVSRRHAYLIYENGAWFVYDLDSTNGTRVNGKDIAPKTRVPLKNGDRLEFGEVQVILFV